MYRTMRTPRDLVAKTLLLDTTLVASVATGLPRAQAAMPFRFTRFQPHDSSAGQLWKDSIAYVRDSVLADDVTASPLVLGTAARLLAAVTLSTFANTATVDAVPHDRNDHHPALLRRAVEYIESNAAADVAISRYRRRDPRHAAGRAIHVPSPSRHHAYPATCGGCGCTTRIRSW